MVVALLFLLATIVTPAPATGIWVEQIGPPALVSVTAQDLTEPLIIDFYDGTTPLAIESIYVTGATCILAGHSAACTPTGGPIFIQAAVPVASCHSAMGRAYSGDIAAQVTLTPPCHVALPLVNPRP